MHNICGKCKDNIHFCIIKKNNIPPKDCPCINCNRKITCNEACDDYYNLRYITIRKENTMKPKKVTKKRYGDRRSFDFGVTLPERRKKERRKK